MQAVYVKASFYQSSLLWQMDFFLFLTTSGGIAFAMTCMSPFAACLVKGSVYSCNTVGPAFVVTLGVQHTTCQIPLM